MFKGSQFFVLLAFLYLLSYPPKNNFKKLNPSSEFYRVKLIAPGQYPVASLFLYSRSDVTGHHWFLLINSSISATCVQWYKVAHKNRKKFFNWQQSSVISDANSVVQTVWCHRILAVILWLVSKMLLILNRTLLLLCGLLFHNEAFGKN